MATQTDHLDSLRQQADQIKEDIKQKRKECRDTTMQQVSIQLIIDQAPLRAREKPHRAAILAVFEWKNR